MKSVVVRFVSNICKEKDEIKLKRFYNFILKKKNIRYFDLNEIAYPISSICLFINFLEKENAQIYNNNGYANCENNTPFKKHIKQLQINRCNNYGNDKCLVYSYSTSIADKEKKIKNFIYFGKKYSISFFNYYLKYILIRYRKKECQKNQILIKKITKHSIIQCIQIENINNFLHIFNAIYVLQNGIHNKITAVLFRIILEKLIQTVYFSNLENTKKMEIEKKPKTNIIDSQTVVEVLTIMNKHINISNRCFPNSNLFHLFYFNLINYIIKTNLIIINDSLFSNTPNQSVNKLKTIQTNTNSINSNIYIHINDIEKYYKKKIFLDINNYLILLSFLKKYEYIFQIYHFQNFSDSTYKTIDYTWNDISGIKLKQLIYETLINIFLSIFKSDCKNQKITNTSIIKLVIIFPEYFYKILNTQSNINKIIIQNNWQIVKQINILSYSLFLNNYNFTNYFNQNIYNHISFFNIFKKYINCDNNLGGYQIFTKTQLNLYEHFFMFIFKFYMPFLYTNNIIYFISTISNKIKKYSKEEKKHIFTIIHLINNEIIKRVKIHGIKNAFPLVYYTNCTKNFDNFDEYIIKYDNDKKRMNYIPNFTRYSNNLAATNKSFLHFFKIYKRHLFNICNVYSKLKFYTNSFIKIVNTFVESHLENMNTKDITAFVYYYHKINYKKKNILKNVVKYLQTNIYQYNIAQIHTILYGLYKLNIDLNSELITHIFTYLFMYILAINHIDTRNYNIYKKNNFNNNIHTELTKNETTCVQNFVKYISIFLNSYNYNDCIILQQTQDLFKVTIKDELAFSISNFDIYKIIYLYKEMEIKNICHKNMEKNQHKKIDNIHNILNILNLLSKYKIKNNIILYDIFYLCILQKKKYNKFVKINDWVNIIIGYSKLFGYNPNYINKSIEYIYENIISNNHEKKNKTNKKDILLLKYLYNHLKKLKLTNYMLIQNIISKYNAY
ncbi:conserved Plasmodium protein, unknown function [Plasmodium berghei]|uniref:Uncharacterized protein n=2 Tax=Plasmodium berghei TaxID=5821 RepID=A0A509AJ54_PLABA|nr:conserved Plasmodium protein, unknown function [Plasmodium berghei ANKA]CXI36714.1 conserved Plasmodium protein, unknown function [Plasmodium berghei]SCM21615.1 conserved Plasmodium protein, unknown function [Plasmodium berghei]SCN24818.1 conserved Plasmodium protein, unknown function [Plasmodium berghei]SCO59939.1 conserved Plasmodium protein, unknown function [Plasmodium berghei]SCO61302.1 conserved Plasmodium protein, unknown function [Plasmodium berghei]|eukprot:XP_034421309.1 conserved Plasmodium protein, unknown function [Plasmodium berghei ANKA]